MPARIVEPTEAALSEAGRIIRKGGLVAFPTETVYGLGAHALDAEAVERIFLAKGRPADNPVIVHVADVTAARALAGRWTISASRLAESHWPGPLTLVVDRVQAIPDAVTAGGGTVGLRVPQHPVAIALLRVAGCPIAAPSANRSEAISPTTAQHVADSLGPWVDDLLILDGGACRVGLESTVVDATGEEPIVLRPGVLRPDLATGTSGSRELRRSTEAAAASSARPPVARSPGQRSRHYAPGKPLEVVDVEALDRIARSGDGVFRLPLDPEVAAMCLYAELRRLDADPEVRRILVGRPPAGGEWEAIRDRLRRASTGT